MFGKYDIYVSRNGNNLKLKVKSEFSLSMALMLINHSNPYIHSTTILCDDCTARPESPVVRRMMPSGTVFSLCPGAVDIQ